MRRTNQFTFSGTCVVIAAAQSSYAQKIYWTDAGRGTVSRANLDGSEVEDVVTGQQLPSGLALDLHENRLYWSDPNAKRIFCAALNGSRVAPVIDTNPNTPRGIALSNNEIFWTSGDNVMKSDKSGSVSEMVLTTNDQPLGSLDLDLTNEKIYWVRFLTLGRANMDGSEVESVYYTGTGMPYDVHVDDVASTLYYSSDFFAIWAVSMGQDYATLILDTYPERAWDFALDRPRQQVFFISGQLTTLAIWRGDLTTHEFQPLLTEQVDSPHDLAVDSRLPGDCDENRFVNLHDILYISKCFSGPSDLLIDGCACLDMDRDADVDIADWSVLLNKLP